jgi:predicted alpha/beta-hydrolase family hydrolase
VGAVAVLCLAFPLEPPPRAGKPRESRLAELDAVRLPTLVVQGERDRFGIPPPGASRTVVQVPGDHGLKADLDAVAAAVRAWLPGVIG